MFIRVNLQASGAGKQPLQWSRILSNKKRTTLIGREKNDNLMQVLYQCHVTPFYLKGLSQVRKEILSNSRYIYRVVIQQTLPLCIYALHIPLRHLI